MWISSVNPSTNEIIKTYEGSTPLQVEEALASAEAAFYEWRKVSFSDRASLMRKAGEILLSGKELYGRMITMEMGKSFREAVAEVEKCALACEYYAEKAEIFLKEEVVQTHAVKSYIAYDPLGVILAVMPWNYPFWQVFRFAAPTIMAGNTAILKHASNVPRCGVEIEQVFIKAGFPEGVFKNLLLESSRVEKLIEDKRIKAVTLTGSDRAGAKVAEAAGRNLKKTVLELGGSDPFIVLQDADLDKASSVAVQARMTNTGQSCIAAKRFIVLQAVSGPFVQLLKQKMSALKIGDPLDPETNYGPMAREDLADELLRQVDESVRKGALILLGGDRPDRQGAYFNPTILTNVKPGMPAYEQELFGPVASIIVVEDEEEAVRVANSSDFGLGASVWTSNIEKGCTLARQIESGSVFINGMVRSDPRLPFGGIKHSGYGRELSYLGIREFVNIKTVCVW